MNEHIEREPYHVNQLFVIFDRKTSILDAAYEAVSISRLAQCDVEMVLDGWHFDVTPHMDVPEIVEAYRKQPDWFVEDVEDSAVQAAALDEEPLVSEMRIMGTETGRVVTQSHDDDVSHE